MNAGELVVSLILNVNRFKAQLQDAQREFDTVQAVAHSAGTGISEASEKSAAAISEISASARDAGRDISSAAERGAADIGNLGSSARDAGESLRTRAKEADVVLMTLGRLLGMLEKNSNVLRLGEVTGSSVCGEPLRKSWVLSGVSHF